MNDARHCRFVSRAAYLTVAVALVALLAFAVRLRAAETPAAGDDFDDPPALLLPDPAQVAEAEARARAAALFAQGRILSHRGQDREALRTFERAYREDPRSAAILSEIVPLAFELERHAEAARYAVIAADTHPRDPVLLRKLAAFLAEEHDYPRAERLYEHAARLSPWRPESPDAQAVFVQFELGRLRYLQGEFAAAAEAFTLVRDALAEPAKHGLRDDELKGGFGGKPEMTRLLLAESFLEAGRIDEAAAQFQELYRADPVAPLAEFHFARVALARGDAAAALARLDKYFAAKSSAAGEEACLLLAKAIAAKFKEPAEAQRQLSGRLEKFQRADAANVPLAFALARHYRDIGQPAKAVEQYVAALRLEPSSEGRQTLAALFRELGRDEELLSLLAEIARQHSSLRALGRELSTLARDKPLVARLLKRAGWPRAAGAAAPVVGRGAHFAAGLLAIRAGEWEAADALLTDACKTGQPPRGEVLLAWATELSAARQAARAVEPLRLAFAEPTLAGKRAEVHFALAGALVAANRVNEALREADLAAALRLDDHDYRLRRAWVLHVAGRHDAAAQAYGTFVTLHESDYRSSVLRDALRRARLALSALAVKRGQLAEAEEWLEEVLDEFPEDAAAANDLGYLWAERNARLPLALRLTRLAVAAEPDNASYRDSLGWVHYRLGQYPDAVVELTKAAQGDRASGVVWDHLGDALWSAGRRDDARDAWRQALAAFDRDRQPERLAEIRRKLQM